MVVIKDYYHGNIMVKDMLGARWTFQLCCRDAGLYQVTPGSCMFIQNHDYKDDPDKFKRSLVEKLPEELEDQSKQSSSMRREKRPSKARQLSMTGTCLFMGVAKLWAGLGLSTFDSVWWVWSDH